MSKDKQDSVYTVESLLKRTQQIHKAFQDQEEFDQDSLVYFQALIICLERIEKATAKCKEIIKEDPDECADCELILDILEGGQDR